MCAELKGKPRSCMLCPILRKYSVAFMLAPKGGYSWSCLHLLCVMLPVEPLIERASLSIGKARQATTDIDHTSAGRAVNDVSGLGGVIDHKSVSPAVRPIPAGPGFRPHDF